MKHRLIILFAALLPVAASAQQRSEAEMAQIATDFLTPKATRAAVQIQKIESTPELSIYTRVGGGWVIVSGDERTRGAILAYSNDGQFDFESETVREWVGGYREQIRSLTDVRAKEGPVSPGTPLVGPLITTKWDQEVPFFINTPTYIYEYQGKNVPKHYPTGCASTAIAQIMNYWQWPKKGQGKHTDIHYPSATVDFSQSEYDWDNMLDEYTYIKADIIYDNDSNIVEIKYNGLWSEVQVDAVAKLMYDCGVALDAQYGNATGSSATSFDILKALCAYFDYSTDARFLKRDDYQGDWDALLRSELDAGRPICYGGFDPVYGGHSFVCDGYDDQGYFHFNFGWSGKDDGYYLTSAIKLLNVQYDNFNSIQQIVYGIHPAVQDDKVILSDGLYYRKSDDGFECFAIENIGPDAHVIIPDKVNDMPVTSIAEGAFYYNPNLKSLEIDDNVKSICNQAFALCSSLDTVTIGSSVQSIGKGAFSETAIRSIVIPSTVESIGLGAFYRCTSLKSAVIGDGVKTICDKAFALCSSLDTVAIGSSVQSIGEWAFSKTAIRSVLIPSSVESIGLAAFQECESLKSAVIGDGVKTIGKQAFRFCTSLDTVIIGSSVETIGFFAFDSTGIRHLVIPSSVELIDTAAFRNCGLLQSVVIGDCVKTIACNAFYKCSSIETVKWGSSVESIGEYAFAHTAISDLVLPSSLTVISKGAFNSCYNLKSVTFPASLSVIGAGAFTECSSLESVDIPNSVESIGWGAFDDCASLKSVVIGSGVKAIGDAAFAENPMLTSVTCLATTPPTCDESKYGVFMDTNISKATLYVPKGRKMTYQFATPWKGFGTIKEVNPTGVEVPELTKHTDEYYLNSRIRIVDGKKYLVR